MKELVYIEGTVEEVSDDGAVIKLADGRTGFVTKGDYFLEEYMLSGFLRPGREVMVRELGSETKGEILIGLKPIYTSEDTYPSVCSDTQWVTSLEEVRGECPHEVAAVERHRLFLDPCDPDCTGWMLVALLAEDEACCTNSEDTSEENEEAETELLDLYDTLCRKFKEKTMLGLCLQILSPERCDSIPTLPLAGTEGSFACNGRCCMFILDGMEAITEAGKKFLKKSERQQWFWH
jgi:hypothetical protein